MEANDKQYIFRPEFGNEADIARLINQHNAYVQVVELFPPHFQPAGDETVLDIGCGPGGWAIDVAFRYPDMSVIGLDIDESAVQYAMARARSSGYENATFEVHDVTTSLPFSDASVDYINICLANSFLLKEQWPRLLADCRRVLRPGGRLRSIEWLCSQTSSFALFRMIQLLNFALAKDGRRYAELAPFLESLMKDAGLLPAPLTVHLINFSEDAPAHKIIAESYYIANHLFSPFILKQGIASEEEVKQLIEEVQRDMMLPHFYGLTTLTDMLAQKPA